MSLGELSLLIDWLEWKDGHTCTSSRAHRQKKKEKGWEEEEEEEEREGNDLLLEVQLGWDCSSEG